MHSNTLQAMSCTQDHSKIVGKFCTSCGAKADTGNKCSNGHAVATGIKFCTECGIKVINGSSVQDAVQPSETILVSSISYDSGMHIDSKSTSSSKPDKKILVIV